MLILPLHKPLNRRTFPLMTAALIVVNVMIFALLQVGDDERQARAMAFYQKVRLDQIELPAYEQWLSPTRREELREVLEAPDGMRSFALFSAMQRDQPFLTELRAERVITPEHEHYRRWQRDRTAFDRQWRASFTENWLLRYQEIDPLRMFSAMFLHGGWDHLIGNMVFLGILGLLVEGALGSGLFLALYLLAGLGGQLFSMAYRWGDPGGALGASGAIAGLMGAFCVLWGLRRVRFFYWAVVVFDYVRAPALLLLVPWLGWELLSLMLWPDAGIGFDAHAGGIISGALLALGVRQMGWERRAFIDEEMLRESSVDKRRLAAEHMGRLEFAQALKVYEQLAAESPNDMEILVPRYRAARYANGGQELHRAVAALLPVRGSLAVLQKQWEVWLDYLQASQNRPQIAAPAILSFSQRLIEGGLDQAGEKLLAVLVRASDPPPGVASAAVALVQGLSKPSQAERRERWLSWLCTQTIDPQAADKARLIRRLHEPAS